MRWHFMATMATLGMTTFAAAMAAMQGAAGAAEIKVLSTNGVKAIMEELVPQFERATGHKLVITFEVTTALKKDIEAGAAFNVTILTASAIDDLIKQGKAKGPGAMIAKSGAGVAVRAGAPKPDIGTADAFKRALLAAKSVAYTTQGASGQYFVTVLDRLGIAAEIKAKAKTQPGGAVAELVARGEAEIAVQQISELLPVKGADYVGPFPPELQNYTAFTAALGPAPREPAAARAFIDFLTAPSAVSVIKAKGMEPG
jgi:molybdate transport system substrate-binding protein